MSRSPDIQLEDPREAGREGGVLFHRVLLPLDGSKLSEESLAPAADLVHAAGGALVLFHAVAPAQWFSMPATRFVAAERRRAETYLGRLSRAVEREGMAVGTRVVTGEASRAIIAAARREKVGLIAMATHGRSGVREWAFGSVAERVLRTTTLPVLLFRGRRKGPFALRRILVALDGTEPTLRIVPVAGAAAAVGADVAILHVGDRIPDALDRAAEDLARMKVGFRTLLRQGPPADTILATAAAEEADVVAITTSGRTKHDRLFLGSVAEDLLRKADRPLLVVRTSSPP
jgi:nucleotide-binding universal stress UspA family protein